MATNALSFFAGFGIANSFIHYKLISDEFKQGKNYYLSAIPLALQSILFARLNGRLISYIPSKIARISAHGLSGLSICLSLPTALFLACVKHSYHKELASAYNNFVPRLKETYKESYGSFLITKLPHKMPSKLGDRTQRAVHFLAHHAGEMMQTAMVTTGVALGILGQAFFAKGLLTGLTYGALDSRGWIPKKVSLFTETYASLIGSVGILYTGTWLDRVYIIIPLAISFFPRSRLFIQNKLDSSASWCLNYVNGSLQGSEFQDYLLQGPSLEEIDKKFNGSRDLTYQEIESVIESDCYQKCEINVPHCTNFVKIPNLPKDHDLNKLLQFFKAVDWTRKFDLVKAKLSKDDRFIDFLQEQHVDVPKEELKEKIDYYIEKLAEVKKISKEEYAAKWVEEQMSILVNILTGKKKGKGHQKDLRGAITICPQIVAYLQRIIESTSNRTEYEDALLKLAVEAGDYCNQGIKRALSEIQAQIILQCFEHKKEDPMKLYELKLLQSFQDLRYKTILGMYQEITPWLHNSGFFQDIHIFDEYRKFLAFGFYPFTEYEREAFSVLDLIKWKLFFKKFLQQMYDKYQKKLFEEIKKNGNEASYIECKIINQNPNLNDSEKEKLRNWYANIDDTSNEIEITEKSRLLLLITMGVLQPK